MEVKIHFGAIAPKIKDQLAAQNLLSHYKDVAQWQADADAITRLSVRQILPPSQVAIARRKLTKLIADGVAEGDK